MTRRLLAAIVVAALLPSAAAEAKTIKGTVVHRNHRAHSFVVAGRSGKLSAVHARRAPRIGRRVALRARALRNGTFAARGFSSQGESHHADLRGRVTFVDDASRTFTLSDNGASILVHVADTSIALPAVGDLVRVRADLDHSTPTTVEATRVRVLDAPAAAGAVELEGVILAIDETTRTLMLSADDSDASGQAVSVVLPDTFDITAFHVGDRIEIEALLNPDGTTFTAVGTRGDDDAADANQVGEDDQGDVGDDHGATGTEPGDDSGATGAEPGDDNGATGAEPGDDSGATTQSGGDSSSSSNSGPGSGSESSSDGSGGSGSGRDGGSDG